MSGFVSGFVRVRNWEKFQHYKDRNPPWIKLHTDLLDNYEFSQLSESQRWHVVGLWILAARLSNRIPADAAYLTRMLNSSSEVDLESLAQLGFIESCDSETEWKSPWPTRYISEDLRSEVLRRDNHRCKECDSKKNLEIDHLIPVSRGGKSELDNLQVLCRSCNRRKRAKSTTTEGHEATEQVATQIPAASVALARSREESRGEAEERQNSVKAIPAEPPGQIPIIPDPPETTLDALLFVEARKVFGQSIGGKINEAIREKGKPFVLEMIERCRGKDPEAARAYLAKSLRRGEGHDRVVV